MVAQDARSPASTSERTAAGGRQSWPWRLVWHSSWASVHHSLLRGWRGGRVEVPHEAPALTGRHRELELAVAVDVADRGDRQDPPTRELREAGCLLAGRAVGVHEVEARAGEQLPPGRAADVSRGRARQDLEIVDGPRVAEPVQAVAGVPRLHHVVVGQVLADEQQVHRGLQVDTALGDVEPARAVEVGHDRQLHDRDHLRCGHAGAAAVHDTFALQDAQHRAVAVEDVNVLAPRVLDLNKLVANMEKLLQRLIGEDVVLRTALTSPLGAIKADPGQLEQVIVNLAVNSRDAMPRGGQLTIETSHVELDQEYSDGHLLATPGSYVLLTITDTGTGMDADTKSHMFEPFFTTKEQGKGTGLGLPTVYGIIEQSGGYVWVYSELGHGTAFKIYLPRVDAAAEAPPAAEAPAPRGTETVLVVEDDEQVRRLTRKMLEARGHTVLVAADGAAAIQLLESHAGPIQLLVTDVVMPGMGGRELVERVAVLRPSMKVLYLSGYTDDAILRHGVLQAGIAFLQKPFAGDALVRKVREVSRCTVATILVSSPFLC